MDFANFVGGFADESHYKLVSGVFLLFDSKSVQRSRSCLHESNAAAQRRVIQRAPLPVRTLSSNFKLSVRKFLARCLHFIWGKFFVFAASKLFL
jgi:hypothetical protein